MKTNFDIKISQILLFKIVEFTHLNFFLESPCCLITNQNEILEKFFLPCCFTIAQIVNLLKLQELIKVTFFNSDYEFIKQFISINLVEISSKGDKFLGAIVSSHIVVITTTWRTSKVFKAS